MSAGADPDMETAPAPDASEEAGAGASAPLEGWLARAVATPRGRRAATALLLAVLGALLLLRLGATPITRSAEERTRTVADHMLESGDWLVPVMDGAPRVKKPPLYYWLGAGSAAIGGELTPLTLRLPAAIAALGVVVVVLRWAGSLGGPSAGAVAVLALVCMAQFWSLGRRGVAEMPLALCGVAALFLFDRIYWGGRRRLVPIFFLVVLLGFLTKATAALLVIGLPILVQLVRDRALGRLWRVDLVAWTGVTLLASLAWYAAIWLLVPQGHAVLREALLLPMGLVEARTAAGHVRPFWFFLENLPAAAFPGLLLLPLALVRVQGRSGAFGDPRTRFASWGFAALFLAFSALPMKQKHYMAPLLPLLAVAMGSGIARVLAARRELVDAWMRRSAPLLGCAGGLLVVPAVAHLWLAREGTLAVCAVALLLLGAAAVGHVAGRSGQLRVFALSFAVVTLVGVVWVEASFDVWRGRFAAEGVSRDDAAWWQRVFERHPPLRALYQAKEWQPVPSGAVSLASPPSRR